MYATYEKKTQPKEQIDHKPKKRRERRKESIQLSFRIGETVEYYQQTFRSETGKTNGM